MDDRIRAFGSAAGQSATAGLQDEAVAKLLEILPFDDGTGIEREYKGGQYEQYRDGQREDNADLARRFPKNTMAGAGAGRGDRHGVGQSEASGKQLAKDTVAGAALGGATASAGSAVQAAAPALAQLWKNGPPSGHQPALATASAAPRPVPQMPRPAQ